MSDRLRYAVAAILVAIGLYSALPATPTPAPQPPTGLVLRGLFVGETGASDAATLAAFALELADEIEWDAMQAEPFFQSGAAYDELRTRARALRMRGVSIGDRQPRVRAAIDAYLTEQLGTSGGPVSPEQRSKWAASYREIGRACSDVSR